MIVHVVVEDQIKWEEIRPLVSRDVKLLETLKSWKKHFILCRRDNNCRYFSFDQWNKIVLLSILGKYFLSNNSYILGKCPSLEAWEFFQQTSHAWKVTRPTCLVRVKCRHFSFLLEQTYGPEHLPVLKKNFLCVNFWYNFFLQALWADEGWCHSV